MFLQKTELQGIAEITQEKKNYGSTTVKHTSPERLRLVSNFKKVTFSSFIWEKKCSQQISQRLENNSNTF